ncbi:hypothetical protein [Companilactobacillus ginsenosidimutans]|uniref:Ig-like domain-containing protein n=1 Tax=Companilactobacillus ginsenosidimutans TaxID=1007676 RepID=A0A0H4R2X6_9LACO|nr:hypothetical protein [Companilactobacillus ginsenosidimutans]AKP68115.1 hypothetical protein ABM34_11605 [Companilactobacillus ginsenosidimutans]
MKNNIKTVMLFLAILFGGIQFFNSSQANASVINNNSSDQTVSVNTSKSSIGKNQYFDLTAFPNVTNDSENVTNSLAIQPLTQSAEALNCNLTVQAIESSKSSITLRWTIRSDWPTIEVTGMAAVGSNNRILSGMSAIGVATGYIDDIPAKRGINQIQVATTTTPIGAQGRFSPANNRISANKTIY